MLLRLLREFLQQEILPLSAHVLNDLIFTSLQNPSKQKSWSLSSSLQGSCCFTGYTSCVAHTRASHHVLFAAQWNQCHDLQWQSQHLSFATEENWMWCNVTVGYRRACFIFNCRQSIVSLKTPTALTALSMLTYKSERLSDLALNTNTLQRCYIWC